VDTSVGAGRIGYLKDNYDKLNYDTYLLSDKAGCFNLVKNILEQHAHLASHLDLYSVIDLLQTQNAVSASVPEILNLLVDKGYDALPGSDFLLTLESMIVIRNYPVVRDYYVSYLPRWLDDESRTSQKYPYGVARIYSRVIHHALALLLDPAPKYDVVFKRLRDIEDNFQPWPLWEPFFGLSRDHDRVMLSEFPLILAFFALRSRRPRIRHTSLKGWHVFSTRSGTSVTSTHTGWCGCLLPHASLAIAQATSLLGPPSMSTVAFPLN
jgi:hypothetical protein